MNTIICGDGRAHGKTQRMLEALAFDTAAEKSVARELRERVPEDIPEHVQDIENRWWADKRNKRGSGANENRKMVR